MPQHETEIREDVLPHDDRLHRYGLREQPFREAPDAAFVYSDPVLDTYLALLLDRLQVAERVLLLTADRGGGKSTLLIRMLLRGHDDLAFCAFKAKSGTMFNAIENTLLRCWQSEGDGPGAQSLEELICHHFANRRRPTLVIDDAHYLGTDALRAIAGLRRSVQQRCGQSLGVLLAGEPRLTSLVDEVADDGSTLGPALHLELRPLTREQTEAYLRHRLVAGGAKDPGLLSGEPAAKIYRESHGLPLLINHSANRYLQSVHGEHDRTRSIEASTTEEPRNARQQKKALGVRAFAIGGLAVGALLLSWLLPRETHEVPPEIARHPGGEMADPAALHQKAGADPTPLEPASERRGEWSPEGIDPSGDAFPDPAGVPARADSEPSHWLEHWEAADLPAGTDEPGPVGQPEPSSLAEVPIPDGPQISSETPVPQPEATVAPETVPVLQTELDDETQDLRGDSPAPMAAESQADGPAMFDEQWLRQQTRSDFTVQIAASGNLEKLQALSQSLPDNLERAWFAVEREGRPWFSLVAGSYTESASAQASISRLPAPIRENEPWIRTFASIQDALEPSSATDDVAR
ncbi:MAG TPA: AAA family ATPase [Thioalkalivibrio sp.]|nr:AAA family ATPase [Thioalkalivibrio sp.]